MTTANATIELQPIGIVRSPRTDRRDDYWGAVESVIELEPGRYTADALAGLDAFSHLEVVFHFHAVDPAQIETTARHPRSNPEWPRVGIFAQRGAKRPNRLGVSRCSIVRVDGLRIVVRGLDAIDGTPVLDVKPYMTEFAPLGDVRQPSWATELMAEYYSE